MGTEQFGRGIENESLAENVEVDIKQNEANQYDDDIIGQDVAQNPVNTGEQNISGSNEVSGDIEVNDGGDANVTIEWTDGTGTVVTTQEPVELQGVTGTSGNDFNFVTKSTHFRLKIDGTSNDVDATVNAH